MEALWGSSPSGTWLGADGKLVDKGDMVPVGVRGPVMGGLNVSIPYLAPSKLFRTQLGPDGPGQPPQLTAVPKPLVRQLEGESSWKQPVL